VERRNGPDLGEVTFIDSAGIEAMVRARESTGPRLQVRAMHPSVQRVLEMDGLLDWFPFGTDNTGCSPDGARQPLPRR
jgi:anti-anti-sigma factor